MTDAQFDEVRPSAFAIAYRMLGPARPVADLSGLLRERSWRPEGRRAAALGTHAPVSPG